MHTISTAKKGQSVAETTTKHCGHEAPEASQLRDKNAAQHATLGYYEENAQKFSDATANVEFSAMQERFEAYLAPGAKILDFGCGSGRDAKRFIDDGFDVVATDGSPEMCKLAEKLIGRPVRNELFSELDEVAVYDGIWACSSILHLPKPELKCVLAKMERALKPGAIAYTSFKLGTFEGMRNGRYFTDFTEPGFRDFLEAIPALDIEESWTSADVRPGRGEEKWLNLIVRKM